MTSLDLAVRLVRQAVNQDSKKNYSEAARCYREAILILKQLQNSRPSSCRRMQNFMNTKLVQYEERLRILEHHLLQNSDLSKFFKDLESCHFDDCRSSVSSDTKHLYKNPLLVKSLDLIRRGRREDERNNYGAALRCYETGLAALLDLLNKGVLTEKQAEVARVKCLLYHDRLETIRGHLESGKRGSISYKVQFTGGEDSLDQDCDSPVPPTETEQILQMEEVRSCSSRLGSSDSLCERGQSQAPSLHSLYPHCEIKHSAEAEVPLVPLANISSEFSLSVMSISSRKSSTDLPCSRASMTNLEKISVLEISSDDTTEDPELAVLKDQCDDTKSVGSDSGYSDPSPDGTVRDSKSPAGSLDITDHRKSPFSDLSEHDLEISDKSCGEVIPRVIIVNKPSDHVDSSSTPLLPRQRGRQTSRFQNSEKDILTSQFSREEVAVCPAQPKKEVTIASDVYTPRSGQRERIPARATAQRAPGEHGDMNKGCYYLMAALDFCWCL